MRSEPRTASAAEIDFRTIPILAYQLHSGQEQAEKRFQLGLTFLSSLAFAAQSNPRQEGKEDLHSHRNLQEPGALNPSGNKVEKRH